MFGEAGIGLLLPYRIDLVFLSLPRSNSSPIEFLLLHNGWKHLGSNIQGQPRSVGIIMSLSSRRTRYAMMSRAVSGVIASIIDVLADRHLCADKTRV